MEKRGQLTISFVHMIFAIVTGIIFLFGMMAFRTLDKAENRAELITFESSIISDLERIASNYGDVSFKNYKFPSDIGEVVFVDLTANSPGSVSAWLISNYPIIADKINDGMLDDVYLFDNEGNFLKSMDIGELTIAGPGWIAYKNEDGRFRVKLEGKGNEARVGGDFVRTADLRTNAITEIVVEEMPGLRLVLKPTTPGVNAKVTLTIKKSAGEEDLTDNIEIQTLNLDGSNYNEAISFENSYIEIPVESCEAAGYWDRITKEYCLNPKIAKYVINSIS